MKFLSNLFTNYNKSCIYKIVIFLESTFLNYFSNEFVIESTIDFSGIGGPNILGGLNRNPADFIILDKWVFENFILADERFAKALRIFETFVSVNNSLLEKLVSSLEFPVKFDERFKVTSVPFFILDFNILSWELDNFTFKVL